MEVTQKQVMAMIKDDDIDWQSKKSLGMLCSEKIRKEILYQYCGRCFLCGIEEWRTKASLQMHRIKPGKDGGLYILDNIIPVCTKCHRVVEGLSIDAIFTFRHPLTIGESNEN